MTLRHVTELSGEDDDLFGLGGARRFGPGERGGDIMAWGGGAVAFGEAVTTGAEEGLSGKWEGNIWFSL